MSRVEAILETMDYGPAPEAADEVRGWLAAHADGFGHFIDGAFVKPPKAKSLEVIDPARDAPIARIVDGSADDVDAAVTAARRAAPAWAGLSGHERGRHLYALARHIQKRSRFFAVLETLNNGKPIRESRDIDIPLVARHFYHHAGWAALIGSEFPDYGPVGVCGQVIPWNFPLLMLAWKIAPALAAGNTLVLKPAEYTPLTALAFAELCAEAGLPAGVVNIVTGAGDTGAALVAHDGIDKVAFTGSTEVGRIIREATAGSGKKLSLELGGKSPFIVMDDADLDAAVEGVVDAIWFNQGEVCCAGSRILVQEGAAEAFTKKLRARMDTLRVGDPLDKSVDMGALVHPVQRDRVRSLVAKGVEEGLRLVEAGGPLPDTGSYVAPSLFLDGPTSATVSQEEIFGPVGTLASFRTIDEAILLANNTRYGLSASVWSENINVALDLAASMKAGVVWINATNLFDAAAGFGGYRESGFGREGGREGLYEYLAPTRDKARKPSKETSVALAGATDGAQTAAVEPIDRTAKLYVGGKQARPDSGYSYAVRGAKDRVVGLAGLGNRKDIRNAVEAAAKASAWSGMSGHARAQVIYYVAENLVARQAEFVQRLRLLTGASEAKATAEVDCAIRRTFWYAAQADKYDGAVHNTQARFVTLAMNEPWGVMGMACPQAAPLLGFLSLVLPAIALGNRVVAIPSERHPLVATDLYQVFDTSDLPGGVVNIVTGARDDLSKTLADHDAVSAMWYFGTAEGSALVERASAGNLKATWVDDGKATDWLSDTDGQGREYLRRAVQVKNIWVPYGG